MCYIDETRDEMGIWWGEFEAENLSIRTTEHGDRGDEIGK